MSIARKGCHPVTEVKKGQLGNNHPAFKSGRKKTTNGYVLIYKPEHPFRDNKNYVLEHRFIVEQQIGRYLLSEEECHHSNKIKDDNRPKNLMAFINHSAHLRFHNNPNNVKLEEIIFDGRKL